LYINYAYLKYREEKEETIDGKNEEILVQEMDQDNLIEMKGIVF